MGAFSILDNIAALYAEIQPSITGTHLNQSVIRISSGKRINSGADDAAGLMIADTFRANIRALDQAGAQAASGTIRDALIAVANYRGTVGAGMNRLQSAVKVMQEQSPNTQAAESTIRDVNVASETSNLTKYQILSQTGVAAFSKANAQTGIIFSLSRSGGQQKSGSF
jgi:flagellin